MNPPNLATFRPIYSLLEEIKERRRCGSCGRWRMYFCYDCRLYIGDVQDVVPRVKLPVDVDIVKHQHELSSKSTAIHATLLAPGQVQIYDKFSDVPNYVNCTGTVVLCPSKRSIPIQQYISSNGPIHRLVVLDSTWNTLSKLKGLPQLAHLPWVHLSNYKTEYWRPQASLPAEHLATIEAIFHACRECIEAERREEFHDEGRRRVVEAEECNRTMVDDDNLGGLLFWFYFFREKVAASKFEHSFNAANNRRESIPPP